MKLVEVTAGNQVLRNIGTCGNFRLNLDVLNKEGAEFAQQLNSYREDIMASSKELKVIDTLSEDFIMNGQFSSKLVEAMELIGGTSSTLNAFRQLGMAPNSPSFTELNRFMYDGYSVLRENIRDMYDFAMSELENGTGENEVYLDMFRDGIKLSARQFLSFPKFCTIKGLKPELNEDQSAIADDFITRHMEAWTEWVDSEAEICLLELFKNPNNSVLVAPLGIDELMETLKTISPELVNILTAHGTKEVNIKDIQTPEFLAEVKGLSTEEKKSVVAAIKALNTKNTCGSLQLNTGAESIPSAVTIVDVIIGFLLNVGETIVSFAEVIKEDGSIEEMLESIEDEAIIVFINNLASKLVDYSDPAQIAVNIITIPFRLIPTAIFNNPALRYTKIQDLNDLNSNIYELLFAPNSKGDEIDGENN